MITLISDSGFGDKVAEILTKTSAVERIALRDAVERDWSGHASGLVAICTERPYFTASRQIADRLFRANLPASFACVRDSALLVGPLIVPGRSPCYRCYERRMASHIQGPWSLSLERVVQQTMDENWDLRIPGMLPTTPILAAARLARQARLDPGDFGCVTQVCLSGGLNQRFRVHRVHGCDCLPTTLSRGQFRQIAHLAPVLEELSS